MPVRVLGSIAEHTIPSSAASTDAWRDVDLARWAAVNRGTACPSPVPVAPGALPSRRVHPQASTATSKPVPAQQSVTGRLLDPHADGGEEVVRALAAQKFSMLEDKEALRERAAAGGDAGGAPVSVGECLDTRSVDAHKRPFNGTRTCMRWSGTNVSPKKQERAIRRIVVLSLDRAA